MIPLPVRTSLTMPSELNTINPIKQSTLCTIKEEHAWRQGRFYVCWGKQVACIWENSQSWWTRGGWGKGGGGVADINVAEVIVNTV